MKASIEDRIKEWEAQRRKEEEQEIRLEREAKTALEQKSMAGAVSIGYYRDLITSAGLPLITSCEKIIKLKRKESVHFLGSSQYDGSAIVLIISNQRILYNSKDNESISSVNEICLNCQIRSGMVARPLSSILSISEPGSRLIKTPSFRLAWELKIIFDTGKESLLSFDSVNASRLFYVILNEAVERVNDPIKEDSLMPQRERIPDEVKITVWRRDQGACVKCGSRQNLEFDHIIPVSKGGSNTARNIELLCEKCNRTKSNNI